MKQKKQGMGHRNASKSKEKPQKVNGWSQQHFQQLYPIKPQLHTSSTFFTVGLNYKGILLKVKLPTGIANNNLPYIFHKEIYKYLLDMHDPNPLLKTSQIIGFQTIDSDILLDYQISLGKGNLDRKTSFNCLQYISEGKLKKYKICKCLAIGGFSKVYLVRSLRDGIFYAMKVMLKKFISSTQKQNIIENEKSICSKLNHPFIVKLNHSFQTHNFVCFIFDYCPGGQLFYYLKKVKRMNQENAKFYFIEILYGLLYLHQQKIIYRDLKPENLLINHDGHIKIADFGLSKCNIQERQLTYSFCGSTQYMPPEMILREGHSYGVDFYTLGALLYELVTGLPPFYSRDQQEIKDAIINEDLTFPDHIELSPEIKNLLSGLLNKNQKLRIGSMKGLKQILFHPWIGRINSQNVLSKKLNPPYIPPMDEFNFDENELGDDEAEFTQTLLSQNMIPASKQKLNFKDFQFKNQNQLRSEVQRIFQKYKQTKKQNFKKCSSLKNLKQRIQNEERKSIKRQNSSPYLRATSLQKMRTSNRNYSSFSRQNLWKNTHNHGHDNHSLGKTSSKKNMKNSYNIKPNEKLVNCSVRKGNKENKLCHVNSNPFLKKKKLVYNYMV